MSQERYAQLVAQLCEAVGLADHQAVIDRGSIEIEGMEVLVAHFENDPEAMYVNFCFGIVSAGRTLRVFQMMLEANLTLYAQDQAQMGLNPDTGAVILIVRLPTSEDIDGQWIAETLNHYAEHGRYWQGNLIDANEDMYVGLCSGEYFWMKV
jgi:hypothetical protein